MSNLLMPVAPHALEAVTGGAATTQTCAPSTPLAQQLTGLSNAVKDIGNAANKTGFSPTTMLLLGLLMSQRQPVNVFVRRPFW